MLKVERREIPPCGKMKSRFAGKIYSTVFIVMFFFVNPLFAQDYYLKIKKTNGSTTSIAVSSIENLTFSDLNCPATVDDADGNTYNTIIIGDQCWMKENLNVGTKINSTTSGSLQTNNSIIEKYCYNNDEANCTTYGGLYQWNEAMQYVIIEGTKGICPTGWHIPTNEELQILGSDANALKALGQGSGSGAGTNTSGFTGLFAGLRDYYDGNFYSLSNTTYFWSSTGSGDVAYIMRLFGAESTVDFNNLNKGNGFSVRCLKD